VRDGAAVGCAAGELLPGRGVELRWSCCRSSRDAVKMLVCWVADKQANDRRMSSCCAAAKDPSLSRPEVLEGERC